MAKYYVIPDVIKLGHAKMMQNYTISEILKMYDFEVITDYGGNVICFGEDDMIAEFILTYIFYDKNYSFKFEKVV